MRRMPVSKCNKRPFNPTLRPFPLTNLCVHHLAAEGRFLSVELAKPPIPGDFDTWEDKDMRQYHLEGMQVRIGG